MVVPSCHLRVATQSTIKCLHVPSISPSEASSQYVKDHQGDSNYYSPCSNSFLLKIHLLAYEKIELKVLENSSANTLIRRIISDIALAFRGQDHGIGYCGQRNMSELGITSLLATNLQDCFKEYIKCQSQDMGQSQGDMVDRVCIMHQGCIRSDISVYCYSIDILLCYR